MYDEIGFLIKEYVVLFANVSQVIKTYDTIKDE